MCLQADLCGGGGAQQTAFGFLGMWWAHVGMYAVNVVQFSLRARGAAARAKAKAA
jgi:hypothetical protein